MNVGRVREMTYARAGNGVDIATKEEEIHDDVYNLVGVVIVDSVRTRGKGRKIGKTRSVGVPDNSGKSIRKDMVGNGRDGGNAYLEEDAILPRTG